MLQSIRNLFRGAQAPAASAGAGARRGSIFTDVAFDQLLTQLTQWKDPDYLLQKVGINRHDLRQLETDDEIFGALSTRCDALKAVPWHLEDPESEIGKFLTEELNTWADPIIEGAWWGLPYGYSVCEAVYRKSEDGRIRLAKFERKPMQWFEPRWDGTLRYRPPSGGNAEGIVVDQTFKFFLTRHRATYEQPYGEALLSRLYWPWFFRFNGWRFWGEYLERFGMPFLVGAVPNPEAFVKALEEMGIDSVVAAAEGSDIKAIAASGAGEFERFDSVICRRVQKLVLGQTLTTDVDGKGSYAAAQVHDHVRQDKRNADIAMATPTLQRVVNALVALNWGDAAIPPKVLLEDDTGLQMDRAERDAKLVGAGVVRLTKDYIIRSYDYEEGDIEIPDPEAPGAGDDEAGPGGKGKAPGKGGKAAKAATRAPGAPRFTADQQRIEDLSADALAGARSPIDPQAIRGAILAARDPEDLEDRLAVLLRDADLDDFRRILERALFAADVIGYVAAEKPEA